MKKNSILSQQMKIYTEFDFADFPDNVINYHNSIRFADQFKSQLYLLEGGHRMNSQRDILCVLFETFLREMIIISNKHYAEWRTDNPQEPELPDQ